MIIKSGEGQMPGGTCPTLVERWMVCRGTAHASRQCLLWLTRNTLRQPIQSVNGVITGLVNQRFDTLKSDRVQVYGFRSLNIAQTIASDHPLL